MIRRISPTEKGLGASSRSHAPCSLAVDRIRPILQAGAAVGIREGKIASSTMTELVRSGLTGVYRPRAFGGEEIDLEDYLRALIWIAAIDSSSAWCLNIFNTSNWLVSGFFGDDVLAAVFGPESDGVIAGSMVSGGPARVERTKGGYRVSGKWAFVSGCDHADWIFVKAPVPESERGDDAQKSLLVLLPRADCVLGEEWSYSGLEGTGSKDVEVVDAAVPARFAVSFSDHKLECGVPAARALSLSQFRLPSRVVMRLPIAAIAIGVARRAFELFEQNISTPRHNGFQPSDLPNFQARFAESAMEIEHAEELVFGIAASASERARRGDEFSALLRARHGRDLVEAVQLCRRAVDRIMVVSGAREGFSDRPMQQAFRDIHAIACHYSCDRDRAMANYARVRLGLGAGDEVL